MSRELLFEIGTEELPANYMSTVRKDFKNLTEKTFENKRLVFDDCQVYSTPRRLTLYMKGLTEKQENKSESLRGPAKSIAFDKAGKPTKAALGFARGQGVDIDELIIRDGYLYLERVIEGKKTVDILADVFLSIINKMNFPKAMRWGNSTERFIRPIRWLLLLFGEEKIDFSFAGIESDKKTYGHRFLTDKAITIDNPAEYFSKLEDAYIVVDHNKRKELILKQIKDLSLTEGNVLVDEELLSEVIELIEYPTTFFGSFEREYLKLPEEVLTTSMMEHQRYFPVVDKNDNLLPYFVFVRDGAEEYIDEVRYGNEMVLRARLADARFFYDEDLKLSPVDRREKLKDIVYQEKLGSMYDKVQRIKSIASKMAVSFELTAEQIDILKRAAELSKNDLVTEMVNEFSKLQGIVGKEYALVNEESREVAEAIFEQYLPRYAGDSLPETVYGQIISIADKIDSIVGHFSLGHIPSGSQDPFALRRQASGIVKIIIEKDLNLKLDTLISYTFEVMNKQDEKLLQEIKDFLVQRVNNILEEKGIRYDIIKAVIAVNNNDPVDLMDRAEAVMELREDNPALFIDLVRGLVRAKNLASKAEKEYNIDKGLLKENAELDLYKSYLEFSGEINTMFSQGNYLSGLKRFVELKAAIDNFLDNVIVMVEDEDIKNNRLALLQKVSALITGVMDIDSIALD
ncbi:glycine--tRNA ligase subunit beta [Halocella sp. SP3-1]|uniref:glycine--tRNA ligase subunit beta n=1 Tax=Halocella sp. SP3-1 TaxID=2382161 RepID=UPI000F75F4D9|nr:glycine--tRNA ligase subunit beta [Halocella sp. SP3-1]AZO95027.1 glycine--tRNA ligase subunit beta [Halocella sp. SP3-1]MTI61301.1 glycine--tRNA ligase subunit beta [Bacillota bacterium]